MADPDDVMARISQGIALTQRGEAVAAKALFSQVWGQIAEDGDPLHRLSLSHWMADLQDDAAEELRWDLRALAAADLLGDERAGLYPSLHLNAGEAYRKVGDLDAAGRHLRLGLAAVPDLAHDGYGAMIRRGLAGLGERLAANAGIRAVDQPA
jgi:hypothetical protein